MITLAFAMWLIATQGLQIHGGLLLGAFLVDLVAWANMSNAIEAIFTGTTSDQEFWRE